MTDVSERQPTPSEECTELRIPKMDCASEERTVRLALEGFAGVERLDFDLPARLVRVWHHRGLASQLVERVRPLGLGVEVLGTEDADRRAVPAALQSAAERRTLLTLLAINALMFVVESGMGWVVQSTGLLADSLDMLADALVYGLSLASVGTSASSKLRAAKFSGVLQFVLALGALFEVVRRFAGTSEPKSWWMIGVSAVALTANVVCLLLIHRHREGGAHMKASYIFSTNDVIANVGVIVAGALVAITGSRYPDLVVGGVIGVVVLSGAVRILRIRS